MPIVRPAHQRDLARLVAIYNHYVEHSIATFDTAPTSVENRAARFETFSATGPHRCSWPPTVAGFSAAHRAVHTGRISLLARRSR